MFYYSLFYIDSIPENGNYCLNSPLTIFGTPCKAFLVLRFIEYMV